MDKDEEFEARTAAAAEVTARLRSRGITVTSVDNLFVFVLVFSYFRHSTTVSAPRRPVGHTLPPYGVLGCAVGGSTPFNRR